MLCSFKNMLGKPGEGLHSWRIGGKKGTIQGIALVDIILTLFLSILLKKFYPKSKLVVIFILLWVVAILVHKLFCVETSVNKLLFSSFGFDDGKKSYI